MRRTGAILDAMATLVGLSATGEGDMIKPLRKAKRRREVNDRTAILASALGSGKFRFGDLVSFPKGKKSCPSIALASTAITGMKPGNRNLKHSEESTSTEAHS